MAYPTPLDLTKVKVFPLQERRSEARIEEILVPPASPAPACGSFNDKEIAECAAKIRKAKEAGASVMLIYGAHLLKNGGATLLIQMMERGWITHLATNGAGTIHDWEFAFLGQSTESVEKNVATGTFGTWDETGRNIHLALLAGGIEGHGYGRSLGRFICDDGTMLPDLDDLEGMIRREPSSAVTPARADLAWAMKQHGLAPGRHVVRHPWRQHSVIGRAHQLGVPVTVHPGIGYDIIANHPMFNGAVLGRAATVDFQVFGAAAAGLDGGVVLSIGSAIMGPQVFEKSLSCVNNLRLQAGGEVIRGHAIYVVDLQDGGNWDWKKGEPPKENPAYYLRFCKSYSRMGGEMRYLQCDNVAFLHNLHVQLGK